MVEERWSYNEFLAFLLIYVANIDIHFAEEEKAMIRSIVGEDTFDKMFAIFDSISDFRAYETILSYKSIYFPNQTEKDSLMEKIKDIFEADFDFNIMEKELLHFLDKMM
ncbi:MAG: hypothetical protein WAT22_07165 [Saprospiraceae bacterium]